MIESMPDTDAIMILNDNTIVKTSGAEDLIRQAASVMLHDSAERNRKERGKSAGSAG